MRPHFLLFYSADWSLTDLQCCVFGSGANITLIWCGQFIRQNTIAWTRDDSIRKVYKGETPLERPQAKRFVTRETSRNSARLLGDDFAVGGVLFPLLS